VVGVARYLHSVVDNTILNTTGRGVNSSRMGDHLGFLATHTTRVPNQPFPLQTAIDQSDQ